MQLSVPRYGAIGVERGANLDTVDAPLNNRAWLKQQFAEIRALKSDADQLRRIEAIVHWTDPGPGGFYDEPGNPLKRPHLVIGPGFLADPGSFESARVGFCDGTGRIEWKRCAETLWDTPLRMRYAGLDTNASYRLRVVYGSDSPQRKIRCMAGDVEIHPYMARPFPQKPMEFAIPPGAIRSGELNLSWNLEPGLGGNGRRCQICEVWLVRAP
jgi:hypothetical protein